MAPYCNKCRAKPFKKQFFLCRRCQAGLWNRRFGALFVDSLIIVNVPMMAAGAAAAVLVPGEAAGALIIYGVNAASLGLLLVRDSLFRGAGPGKRMSGLRVVQVKDGVSPPTHGQGVVRWLLQLAPFINLVDASAAYRDPLLRRYGDRWAGTRVIDSEKKLAKDRATITRRLLKKGVQPSRNVGLTMEGLARLV